MSIKIQYPIVAALMLSSLAIPAKSALIADGVQVIDTDRDIAWLNDANYAADQLDDPYRDTIITTVGSIDGHTLGNADFQKDSSGNYTGLMTWWGAKAWVSLLNIGGFSDWDLPSTPALDTNCSTPTLGTGNNCINSDMGHLFYTELGASSSSSVLATGDSGKLALFTGIQENDYLSQSQADNFAWRFGMGTGGQSYSPKGTMGYAWAIRVVPLPAGLWLFGSGLLGLVGIARRNKA